jgi:hypothetical protein
VPKYIYIYIYVCVCIEKIGIRKKRIYWLGGPGGQKAAQLDAASAQGTSTQPTGRGTVGDDVTRIGTCFRGRGGEWRLAVVNGGHKLVVRGVHVGSPPLLWYPSNGEVR